MAKKQTSYTFQTQPYTSPQQEFELNPSLQNTESSKDFVTPSGFPNDFVSASKGGTFQKLIAYSSGVTPTLNAHLVSKGFMDATINTAIDGVVGDIDTAFIRSKFSATTPIEYSTATGVISLNDNKVSKWDDAWDWGNHGTQNYLKNITTQSIGSLNDVSINTIQQNQGIVWDGEKFVPATFSFPNYTGSSSINISGTTISAISGGINHNGLLNYASNRHFLQTDINTISVSVGQGIIIADGFGSLSAVANNSSNWNTAAGWGNHATAGYFLSDNFNSSFDTRFATKSLADLGTKNHSSLTISGHSDGYHISSDVYSIISNAASTSTSGYLLQADWNTFNNKQDVIVFNPTQFEFDENDILNYIGEGQLFSLEDDGEGGHFLYTDYTIVSAGDVRAYSSTNAVLFTNYPSPSNVIEIQAGSTLLNKLDGGEGYSAPSGWTLSASGANNTTLNIVHNTGKAPSSVTVYAVVGDTLQKLDFSSAYSFLKVTTSKNVIELGTYVEQNIATLINVVF